MVDEKREKINLTKLLEAVLPYQVSVYVTVLNIIQCIALAFLINETRDYINKEEFSLAWALRSAVALTMILVVWHRYINEIQYLWLITWSDTLNPFLIGIVECVIIFSTNPKTTSLNWFVFSIISLQFLATLTYMDAYYKRNTKFTERLYQTFYFDYPQFAFHLTNFLKNYDWWHIRIFTIYSSISFVFLIFIISFPNNWNEIIFPVIYLIEFIGGETLGSFQKALREDKFLGHYFS